MKIVYFGFDLFYECFEQIVNNPDVEVMALYTFPTDDKFEFNRQVIALAEKKGIPVHLEKITKEALEKHFAEGCDFTLSAGYIHKIPILERENFKGVNVHPALLPVGRGAWPFPCTILKGLTTSGVTIHKITDRFDEGDILLQKSVAVSPDETLDTLTEKCQRLAADMMAPLIADFNTLWNSATPQGEGEYWPEPTDTDRTITDDMSESQKDLIKRAFGSFGVIYK